MLSRPFHIMQVSSALAYQKMQGDGLVSPKSTAHTPKAFQLHDSFLTLVQPPRSQACIPLFSMPGISLRLRGLDCTCHPTFTTSRAVASEAADDDVEDGDKAIDNGLENATNAVDDGHDAGAD